MMTNYLIAEKVVDTIELLQKRIVERFPDSGLGRVCLQLLEIGRQTGERSRKMASPNWRVRFAVGFLIFLIIATSIVAPIIISSGADSFTVGEFVQVFESALNDILLIGAAIFFLVTLETRLKRRRALAAVHELRSIAHIIDMHQLTKDPERLLSKEQFVDSAGPKLRMSRFELRRYLDYCSEMLSLTGKVAALYTQHFDDGVTLQAVNEVEELTTGLSRKVWQKIMVLHSTESESTERAA